MKIFLTGLHSSANPQPGVGTARSLRLAFPKAELIGVDYSARSSGIHWPDFDAVRLQRPWSEMHLPSYAAWIARELDAGAFWIAGSDLENRWLAQEFEKNVPRGLLGPCARALDAVAKPAVPASEGLSLATPPFVRVDELSDWDLHRFCTAHDWDVWLKGPYYDAVRIWTWAMLEQTRAFLSQVWSTDRLFLQAHMTGREESICFSAYRGRLLGAVRMRKRELTETGKTWAGSVAALPAEILAPLQAVVGRLAWTGGGELEIVRDADGGAWLLEWNPRFPAWIHGATLAGFNLPALLVEAASGVAARPTPPQAAEFSRVVLEVPVRAEFPLPPPQEAFSAGGGGGKHPSGLTALAMLLHRDAIDRQEPAPPFPGKAAGPAPVVPCTFIADLQRADFDVTTAAPGWFFLEETARASFTKTAQAVRSASRPGLEVQAAYSIKTNPDPRLLALARENGLGAEAISLLEMRAAMEHGFLPEQIVLNGPGKWHPDQTFPDRPLGAIFADSLPDLQRILDHLRRKRLQAGMVGVRLRPPGVTSRFGVALSTPDEFEALARALQTIPEGVRLGAHFHFASSSLGVGRWWQLFESTLGWCRALESLIGRPFAELDLGGGWGVEDWEQFSGDHLPRAVGAVLSILPGVDRMRLEPGKCLAQSAMAFSTRILEVSRDRRDSVTEVVVDGSIADLPMSAFQPHRLLFGAPGRPLRALGRGPVAVRGRLCMEHDQVAAAVAIPNDASPGDILVFCDAGGYDKSMSYVFGCG